MVEEIELEKCNFRNFTDAVTLTLTLNRVIRHTVVHHSSTCMCLPNFIDIGKTFFLDGLTAGTPPSSRSRDTKTRTNFKIRPDQIQILCSSLRISGHLPAPSVSGGGDKIWKVQFSELQRLRDLDLDFELGHTAYRHASLIDLYVHTKFHWNRKNFLWMDVRTDGCTYWRTDISPLMLLGRLLWVDLINRPTNFFYVTVLYYCYPFWDTWRFWVWDGYTHLSVSVTLCSFKVLNTWCKNFPHLVKHINVTVDITETKFKLKFPISWASNVLWDA